MTTKSPLGKQTEEAALANLINLGFTEEFVETPRRLICSVSAREKCGKTHFALTADDPIMFFDIDIGAEGVVGKFQAIGKKVYRYQIRVRKNQRQDVYQRLWEDLRTRLEAAWSVGRGSVIMDTASEAYELARLAKFGKLTQVMPHHYTEVNNDWRELMRLAYDSPMNTILIHKTKPKYINNVRTGEYEIAGFADTGYLVQANITAFKERNENGETVFGITVEDCRQNATLNGMMLRGMPLKSGSAQFAIDPILNFNMLLSLVHGS